MTNREKAELWFLFVWNERRFEKIEEFVAADCHARYFSTDGSSAFGIPEILKIMQKTIMLIPDLRFQVVHTLEDGPFTSSHWIAEGHRRNVPINLEGLTLAEWKNGRMTSGLNGFDPTEVRELD